MPVKIVVPQRCLGKLDTEILDTTHERGGIMPVPPAVAEVECERDRFSHHGSAILQKPKQPSIRKVLAKQHRHLQRSNSLGDGDLGLLLQLCNDGW